MTTVLVRATPPCASTLQNYAQNCKIASRPFNHGFMPGGPAAESNLRIIEFAGVVGHGRACYRRACKRLLSWQMHEGSELTGIWTDGNSVVTYTLLSLGRLWVVNPCRQLTMMLAGPRMTSIGYATTRGHLIAGCERMSVRHCPDGSVRFEVHSASRGSGLLGRAIFPFLVPAQKRFFKEQVRCMCIDLDH